MRKLLLQLDSARLPSAFDRIVAFDGGADEVLSYGGVAVADVRELVHGAIFTRGPRDLHHTALFIGGPDVAVGEQLLSAAQSALFGPFRVSMMLDANGSNTTAVAAVARIREGVGDVRGRRALVVAGTGPVGQRVAGLLAAAGADVIITSRHAADGERARELIMRRFGGSVTVRELATPAQARDVLGGAFILVAAGPAGVQLVPREAWEGRPSLRVVVDLNAVPPLGIDGVDVGDNAIEKDGTMAYGALGVGGLKMKLHRACIARLFERNDLVLDVEAIAQVASELSAPRDRPTAPELPGPRAPEAQPR